MNEFEQICFEMIASSGSAKTFYMSALKEAKDGRFAQAEHTMEAGMKRFSKHRKLIPVCFPRKPAEPGMNSVCF
ncbi:PTS lactose/cellobiose transporter subunit IIA [Allobaculum sp. Allo2]|nr:PTS lactose/cellobiose transporter subunit IIA [Allobaculum sp. Allo2]UNT92475.1 PTS lactose/cellobiose transporter subunit IIA [Allobaculum sp. Allo2]